VRELRIATAQVFEPLLQQARYKGAKGGRGSGKSHNFADNLIEDCMREPGDYGEGMRAVCIREVQKDLAQSSKLLLETKLKDHRLGEADGFKVFRDVIQTPSDGVIIFKGMNDYTADSIKSLEGFKRSWWEEAQTATLTSLNMLRPTLRAEGAERWFSWNPRRKTDAIEQLFDPNNLPTGAILVKANWRDNPWFTNELELERQDCLRTQPDQYDHIWEGGFVKILSGAYYAASLAKARAERRIGHVTADPLLTYRAFVDIGGTGRLSDAFTMWIMQFVGREIRALNYYEVSGQPIAAHLNWLRENNYTKANTHIVLPHDGETNDKVYDVSYQSAFKGAGYETTVVPNQGRGAAKMRIEAANKHFAAFWFNEATTQPGLDALGWYHEKKDDARGIGLGPDHDWSSHGADSFGLAAICAERIWNESGKVISDPYAGMRRNHG
jgi:phage terminase large subunit